jgi:hypothetical protein
MTPAAQDLRTFISHQGAKETLWLWLRMTVTETFNAEYYDQRDRERILALYEKFAALLEEIYSD